MKNDKLNNPDLDKGKYTEIFSVYKPPVTNTTPTRSATPKDVYDIISGFELYYTTDEYRGHVEEYRRFYDLYGPDYSETEKYRKIAENFKKNSFPYATPGGTFSTRADKNLITASGLMVLDLDHLENITEVKERLINDKVLNPILIFTSPGGEGLKVFVRIAPTREDLERVPRTLGRWWKAINHYFSIRYADIITPQKPGEYIDGACKDVSRACFLCFDEDAYYADNSECLDDFFILKYTPTDVKKRENKEDKAPITTGPGLSIDVCSDRWLLPEGNHTPELMKFAGCCINVPGSNPEDVICFLDTHEEKISPTSSKADKANRDQMVRYVYEHYPPNTSPEVIFLSNRSFAYLIWEFVFRNKTEGYYVRGFYYPGVFEVLSKYGIFKRYISERVSTIIQVDGCVMTELSTEQAKDIFVQYLNSLDDIKVTYSNRSYTHNTHNQQQIWGKQNHNIFNKTTNENLHEDATPILKDTKNEAFFTFGDGMVSVTKDGVSDTIPYSKITDKRIWKDRVIGRDFVYTPDNVDCEYSIFLANVSDGDESRYNAIRSAIGYLLHSYRSPSMNNAVILYDEAMSDRPQGGTGKGIIGQSIEIMKPTVKIDGKKFDGENRFGLQSVDPGVSVVWLDDPKKGFKLESLFTALTNGLTIERKYLPEIIIPMEDSPKWLICSNAIISDGASSNKRRHFQIELSSYYSSKIITGTERPIEDEHGGLFFKDNWDTTQWNKFFSFMLDCVCYYLNEGLQYYEGVNIARNQLIQDTNSDFVEWIEEREYQPNQRYNTTDEWDNFKNTYPGFDTKQNTRQFSNWLKKYAEFENWNHKSIQSNGVKFFEFFDDSV